MSSGMNHSFVNGLLSYLGFAPKDDHENQTSQQEQQEQNEPEIVELGPVQHHSEASSFPSPLFRSPLTFLSESETTPFVCFEEHISGDKEAEPSEEPLSKHEEQSLSCGNVTEIDDVVVVSTTSCGDISRRKKHGTCQGRYIVHSDGAREKVVGDDDRVVKMQRIPSFASRKEVELHAREVRKRAALAKASETKPYFTVSITLIEIVIFVFELAKSAQVTKFVFGTNVWYWGTCDTGVIVDLGGKVASIIVNRGEWWRFVTPIILHVSIVHITFNLVVQIKVGIELEKTFGSVRLFVLYFLSGVAGNILSSCFLFDEVQVGASGALFGLLGLFPAHLFVNWKDLYRPVLSMVFVVGVIVLSVLCGMMPGVDNFAHVGGLLVGLVGGFALLPRLKKGQGGTARLVVAVVTLPFLLALFGSMLWLFYGKVAKGNKNVCPWCMNINCPSSILGKKWCST